MNYLYLVICIVFLAYLVKVLLNDIRRGLLIGLTISTFTLFAFPWQVFPFWGMHAVFRYAILGLILVYALLLGKAEHKFPLKGNFIILILLFWFILFVFLIISPEKTIGFIKSIRFFDKVVLPILAYGVLCPLVEKDKRSIINSILVSSIFTVVTILLFSDFQSSRASIINGQTGTITLGRTVGLGAVIAFFVTFQKHGKVLLRMRFVYIGIFTFLLIGIFFSGSRGPIFAVTFSIISVITIFQVIKGQLRSSIKVLLVLLPLSLIVFNILDVSGVSSVDRVINSFDNIGEHKNDRDRLVLYRTALDIFVETKGVGSGTGGFIDFTNTTHEYPHNIVLEILAEQGVIGISLLLSLFIIVLFPLLKKRNLDVYEYAMLGIFFFTFYNALVSFDIVENAVFWVALSLLWYIGNTKTKVF